MVVSAKKISFAAVSIVATLSAPASAAETITYTYDELGRLRAVVSSGTVNNGQATSITFDAAGNRINYTVTGAP
jgi:hypothetical protein